MTALTTPSEDTFATRMEAVERQLAAAEQVVGSEDVFGTAGDGGVRIGVRGEFSFTSVAIDPRLLDPAETELLEDLVLAALRDAVARLAERRRTALGAAMCGILSGLVAGDDGTRHDVDQPPTTK